MRFIWIDSDGEERYEDYQPTGYKQATNNEMELQGCITALEEAMRRNLISGVSKVIVYTDSMYVVNNYKKAMFEWPKTRWHRRSGAPVLNASLWKDLTKLMRKVKKVVEFEWVKGKTDRHTRAVDKMAKRSAKGAQRDPLSVQSVRRKITSESVERGSVKMEGQRLTIRIISTQYLTVQRIWKLKYEVMSKRSPYYSKVDIIFSDDLLSDGHTYYIKVNNDTENPRVEKVYREIKK